MSGSHSLVLPLTSNTSLYSLDYFHNLDSSVFLKIVSNIVFCLQKFYIFIYILYALFHTEFDLVKNPYFYGSNTPGGYCYSLCKIYEQNCNFLLEIEILNSNVPYPLRPTVLLSQPWGESDKLSGIQSVMNPDFFVLDFYLVFSLTLTSLCILVPSDIWLFSILPAPSERPTLHTVTDLCLPAHSPVLLVSPCSHLYAFYWMLPALSVPPQLPFIRARSSMSMAHPEWQTS